MLELLLAAAMFMCGHALGLVRWAGRMGWSGFKCSCHGLGVALEFGCPLQPAALGFCAGAMVAHCATSCWSHGMAGARWVGFDGQAGGYVGTKVLVLQFCVRGKDAASICSQRCTAAFCNAYAHVDFQPVYHSCSVSSLNKQDVL